MCEQWETICIWWEIPIYTYRKTYNRILQTLRAGVEGRGREVDGATEYDK